MVSVAQAGIRGGCDTRARRGDLARFRHEFYTSLTARADALFELTDAVLCADGPVRSLAQAHRGAGGSRDMGN